MGLGSKQVVLSSNWEVHRINTVKYLLRLSWEVITHQDTKTQLRLINFTKGKDIQLVKKIHH